MIYYLSFLIFFSNSLKLNISSFQYFNIQHQYSISVKKSQQIINFN